MHELTLADLVLTAALDAAHGERVRRVRVCVGDKRELRPEALSFCFTIVAHQTDAQDAQLELEQVAGDVIALDAVQVSSGQWLAAAPLAIKMDEGPPA